MHLEGGGVREQFVLVRFVRRIDRDNAELTGGERAGFVEDHGVDLPSDFEEARALDQYPEAGSYRERGDHRRRRGEHKGARHGDDDHRDRPLYVVGEKEDETGDDQNERHVIPRVSVDQAHDRRTRGFRFLHDRGDATYDGVASGPTDDRLDRTGEVERAGENPSSWRGVDREGLSGDRRLVDAGEAHDNFAIGGNRIARQNTNPVSALQGRRFDERFLRRAIQFSGLDARKPHERFYRFLHSERGVFFEDLPDDQDGRDDRARCVLPRGETGQDRQGDELVHVVFGPRNDNYFPAVTTIRNRHVFEGV